MKHNEKITNNKLAEKLAGVYGKPRSHWTPQEQRDVWSAQNRLRNNGGKNYRLPDKLKKLLSDLIDERNELRDERELSKTWREMHKYDESMKCGVPKSGL